MTAPPTGAEVRASTEALRRIGCPVLVMNGDFLPTPSERRLRDEASGRPNVRIVRFEHMGHLIHRDALPEFVALVREFFRDH